MQLERGGRESKYILFVEIFMLSNKLQTIGDSYLKEITTKQWLVLLVLNILDNYSPTLNELSDMVGSSHQNVKQLVLKLEQKGYVKLLKDKEDGRRLRIMKTPKATEFALSFEEKNKEFMARLFANLDTKDLDIALNVLLEMKKSLEGMEKDYVNE